MEDKLKLDIAYQVVRIRKQKRLTQAVVARRMGVSPNYLMRVELGTVDDYSVGTLVSLARALGKRLEIRFPPRPESSSGK